MDRQSEDRDTGRPVYDGREPAGFHGDGLQWPGNEFPVASRQNDGQNEGVIGAAAILDGGDFFCVDVIRIDKGRADQQKEDIRGGDGCRNAVFLERAGVDCMIRPDIDVEAPAQCGHMLGECRAFGGVVVRVGEKAVHASILVRGRSFVNKLARYLDGGGTRGNAR